MCIIFMHIPCIMHDGKGTVMGHTSSARKLSDKPLVIFIRFFAVALILAHVISFVTGSHFCGLCTYPAAWLTMIIFMMVEHHRQKGEDQLHSR